MQMEQASRKSSHVFGTNMADLDLSNLSDMLKAYWSTAVYFMMQEKDFARGVSYSMLSAKQLDMTIRGCIALAILTFTR